jgi:uncharacterized protein YbaA (DUF1428 family)
MNNSDRLRRTTELCLACLRGIAYYRAGQDSKDQWIEDDFWRHNNSNSIDMAVIDWCKVFGDKKAEHYWRKSVDDPDTVLTQMLAATNISNTEFEEYILKVREYRDKFLAHLDKDNVMHIPQLDIAIGTTIFLYNHLATSGFENVIPKNGQSFYESRLKYAEKKYANAT